MRTRVLLIGYGSAGKGFKVDRPNGNILCTICARAGSKGLKDKNIKLLAGKPLIAYTIQQVLKWGRADYVVVSTDSEKIARIARGYGAKVPFIRPKRLAGDRVAKIAAIRHTLIECEKFYKERFEIIVDLDVTAPIRKVSDLDNCLKLFLKKRPKTLFSVVESHRNPYFNIVEKKGERGYVKICKRLPYRVTSRQEAPRVYDMNASIYIYSRGFLLDRKNTTPFSKKTAMYVMDGISQYDIDNELDFRFVEFLIREGIWKSEV